MHYIESSQNTVADMLSRKCLDINTDPKMYSIYLGSKIDYIKLSNEQFKNKTQFENIQPPPKSKYLSIGNQSILFLSKINENNSIQVLVPKNCVNNVISAYHNLHHHGIKSTLNMLYQRFYWTDMRQDVINFIKTCIPCQQNKSCRLPQLPIHLIKEPDHRFKHIHLDLIGKLSGDPEYSYTLNIRDRFTGYLTVIPLIESNSETILNAFITNYISKFGIPEIIVTDNASNLNSETIQLFVKKLSIKHINSTPYHPASNGLIERPNQQIKAAFKCLRGYHWSKIVPIIALCFNNSNTKTSTYTPAQLTFGCNQRLPNYLIETSTDSNPKQWPNETIELFFKSMNMLKPKRIDHHTTVQPLFTFKDLDTCESVWVKNKSSSNTLDYVFTGPYKVLKREERYFVLKRDDNEWKVSKEHIKPTYTINEQFPDST